MRIHEWPSTVTEFASTAVEVARHARWADFMNAFHKAFPEIVAMPVILAKKTIPEDPQTEADQLISTLD